MTLSVSFVKPLPEYGGKGTPVSLLKCNGIEFHFQFRKFGIRYNDIDTVEIVINSLNDTLVNFDYEGFRKINKKHKNIALVLCKEVLEKEFNKFIEKSYYDLSEDDEVFTYYSIMHKFGIRRTSLEKTTVAKAAWNIYCELSKKEFEEAMIKRDSLKVAKLYKRVQKNYNFNFFNECNVKIVYEYIFYIGEFLIKKGIEPTPQNLVRYIVRLDLENLKKKTTDVNAFYKQFKKEFVEVSLKLNGTFSQQAYKNIKYNFEDDIWVIYNFNRFNTLEKLSFTFEHFTNSQKKEVKLYIDFLIKSGNNRRDSQKRLSSLKLFYLELNNLEYRKIESIIDVKFVPHLQHLVDHFFLLKKEDGGAAYSYFTISTLFYRTRDFFYWVSQQNNANIANPFNHIIWKNKRSFSKKTEFISEEVIEKINECIHELEIPYQNIWIILMQTGMRISECTNLEEDWLYYDQKSQTYLLKYVPLKIEKARKKRGDSIYQIIPASDSLVKAFKRQEELTRDFRKYGPGTKKIFISSRNFMKRFQLVNGARVTDKINKLCSKYNITESNGEPFYYHHHKCRKTVIVELIDKNSSMENISEFIGHDDIQTTLEIYAEVKEKKILELESHYFDEVFNFLHRDKFQDLPKEDVESIIKEMKEGARLAAEGQGYCGKHVTFGPCVKNRCIGCTHFITTPKQIPIFKQMILEQQEALKVLENHFLGLGTLKEEYKNYKSYKFELNLLELLQGNLDELINFVKEKIPFEEQSKYI